VDLPLTRKLRPEADSDEALGPRPFATLLVISLIWAFVYLVLQDENGYFARTVEQVESPWLQLTALNVPLHLALTVVMALCSASRHRLALKAGLVLGVVNVTLIAAHVVLSIATA
jgi:hypothetical protein